MRIARQFASLSAAMCASGGGGCLRCPLLPPGCMRWAWAPLQACEHQPDPNTRHTSSPQGCHDTTSRPAPTSSARSRPAGCRNGGGGGFRCRYLAAARRAPRQSCSQSARPRGATGKGRKQKETKLARGGTFLSVDALRCAYARALPLEGDCGGCTRAPGRTSAPAEHNTARESWSACARLQVRAFVRGGRPLAASALSGRRGGRRERAQRGPLPTRGARRGVGRGERATASASALAAYIHTCIWRPPARGGSSRPARPPTRRATEACAAEACSAARAREGVRARGLVRARVSPQVSSSRCGPGRTQAPPRPSRQRCLLPPRACAFLPLALLLPRPRRRPSPRAWTRSLRRCALPSVWSLWRLTSRPRSLRRSGRASPRGEL